MFAAPFAAASAAVPGHSKAKHAQDDNGIPDAGVYVTGHHSSAHADGAAGA